MNSIMYASKSEVPSNSVLIGNWGETIRNFQSGVSSDMSERSTIKVCRFDFGLYLLVVKCGIRLFELLCVDLSLRTIHIFFYIKLSSPKLVGLYYVFSKAAAQPIVG
jgi:hypothetical protein